MYVKLLLAYGTGLLLGIAFPYVAVQWPIVATLLLVGGLLWKFHGQIGFGGSKAPIWELLLMGLLFYVGIANTQLSNPVYRSSHYTHSMAQPGVLLLRITEPPQAKTIGIQAIAEVTGKVSGGMPIPLSGKVLVVLPIDSHSAALRYGDEIAINAQPQDIAGPKNPYEFDSKSYLAQQHIHHQLMPKPGRWYATGHNSGNKAYNGTLWLRGQCQQNLRQAIPDTALHAVATAMLLGDKSLLNGEIRERYSITGSMHVLAVSGMHVAYLYLLLWLIAEPLKRYNKLWLRLGLILVVVWFYAMLTGLSPSVLRASLMFSFYAIGQTLKRKPNSLNILAASALVLLLFEPKHVLDVGFQLSYLAVLGIVFFYRPLRNLLPIKHWIPRLFWEGTCVSVAAQLATFPLVMYYFHQMPVYALVANLFMLLLAPVVMSAGLLYLVFFCVPALGFGLGWVLNGALWVMHGLLGWIATLPLASIKNNYPMYIEVVLLLAVVASLMYWARERTAKRFLLPLCLAVLFLATNNIKAYRSKFQEGLIVYQITDQTAVAALRGNNSHLWATEAVLCDTARQEQSIMPYLHANLSHKPTYTETNSPAKHYYGMVGEKRYAIVNHYLRRNLPHEKLQIDYLILTNNPSLNMQEVQRVYTAQTIVIDGSNNAKTAQRWMQECAVLGLDCYHTRSGAFTASW